MLLSLDFEKAYDSVRWSFLRRCLEHYGFGPVSLRWIEVLLADAVASILVNGEVTDRMDIERAVRQGDESPCPYPFRHPYRFPNMGNQAGFKDCGANRLVWPAAQSHLFCG